MALQPIGVEATVEKADSFFSTTDKMNKAVAAFVAPATAAAKAVDAFGASANKAAGLTQDAAGRWRTATGQFATDAEKAAAGVETIAPAAKKAGDATKKAGSDAEQGGKGFSAFGQVVIGALREAGAMAMRFAADAGRAIAGFLKDTIGVAGDFEAGMNKFAVVAGKGVDTKGLEKFKDLFIQLGRELPVSTTEVENAATEMVSGGIDPAIVAGGALRQTLNFAAASGLSLADAAATSAKFLAGWTDSAATTQEKVDFLTLSTDTLTKAAAASSTTAAELRLGLFNVQGSAQALHASFGDVTTVLAELAPAFESSAQAGTALNVFLTRLVPQTRPATDAMKELGLITAKGQNLFFDSKGAFLGLSNAAEVLKQKISGLTDEQKIETLHTLFGNDAMKVANLLAQDGAAGYQAMAAKMNDANGVAAAAATMQQGYNVALENAKGSVEALQITIGSALLPVLTDLMNNTIAPAINTLTTMASAIGGSDEAFQQLTPTAQAIVSTIDVLAADVQELVGAFNDGGASTAAFATRIGDLATDLGLPGQLITGLIEDVQGLITIFSGANNEADDLSTAMAVFGASATDTAHSITPLFDSTVTLGSALTDLTAIWDEALTVATDVGNGYLAIAQAVLPVVTKFWADHGTEITTFAQNTYTTINRIVMAGLQLYDAVVPPILQAIAGFFATHGTAIGSILSGAYDVLAGIVTGGLALIEGVITTALDLINGKYDTAWGDITRMSATFVTSLLQVITGGLELIAGAFGTSLTEIANTWQHNWDAMVEIAMKIGGRMVAAGASMVQGIIKGVKNEAGALYQSLIDMGSHAFDKFMQGIQGGSPALVFVPGGESIVQGIALGIQQMIPGLLGLVDSLDGQLTSQFSHVSDSVSQQISDMVQGIQEKVKSAQDAVNSLIASGFGATASISRQVASNLGAFADSTTAANAKATADALAKAETEAHAMTDPEQGAKYFKMRSDQILQLASLQKALAEQQKSVADSFTKQQDLASQADQQRSLLAVAASEAEREAILAKIAALNAEAGAQVDARHATLNAMTVTQQQLALIGTATDAEIKGFAAQQAASGNAVSDAAAQLRDILNANLTVKGKTASLPGIDDPTVRALNSLLDRLVSPVATPGQIASSAQYINNTTSNSYNLGIQTNNSPAALQQSYAVMQAMNP